MNKPCRIKEMTFEEYQEQTKTTAVYPQDRNFSHNVSYLTLGLVSEAGEVAGKLKKVLRDERGVLDEEKIAAVSAELGDVLWYISQLANELRLDLGEIAEDNIDKLKSRQQRGALSGSGDNR